MKKKRAYLFIILFIIGMLQFSSSAGIKWEIVKDPQHELFHPISIYMTSSDNGWAVGQIATFRHDGAIFRYDGREWKKEFVSSSRINRDRILYSIQMLSSTEGWAVGKGIVLRYQNGQWKEQDIPCVERMEYEIFRDVFILDENNIWIVADDELILHFNGTEWKKEKILLGKFDDFDIYSVYMLSSTQGWCVGKRKNAPSGPDYGVIFYYDGNEWKEVAGNENWEKLLCIEMISETEGWAGGKEGLLLFYNGNEWVERSLPNTAPVNSIKSMHFLSSSQGYLVSNERYNWWEDRGNDYTPGSVWFYNGDVWQEMDCPWSLNWQGVFALEEGNIWIADYEGGITHFDGINWELEKSPAEDFKEISMVSSTEGWIVGERSLLYGNNYSWEPVIYSPKGFLLGETIDVTNSNEIWIGAYNCYYYNGQNLQKIEGGHYLNVIKMISEKEGWAISTKWKKNKILYFNGTKWEPVYHSNKKLYDLQIISPTEGYAVGEDSTILSYNGNKWQQYPLSFETGDIYSLIIFPDRHGWAISKKYILFFKDGKWEKFYPSLGYCKSLFAVSPDNIWGATGGSGLYHYNGSFWYKASNPTIMEYRARINSIFMVSENEGWAVGNRGLIMKCLPANNPEMKVFNITPAKIPVGPSDRYVEIRIKGENFLPDTDVDLVPEGDIAVTETVLNSTEIKCRLYIRHDKCEKYDIIVVGPDTQASFFKEGLEIVSCPKIDNVEPQIGLSATSIKVIITGEYFIEGVKVKLVEKNKDEIEASEIEYKSSEKIIAIFNLPSDSAGVWNVEVENPDGGKAVKKDIFLIDPAPEIVDIHPNFGYSKTTVKITIEGKYFFPDVTATLIKEDDKIEADKVEYENSQKFTAIFNLPSDSIGVWDIKVNTSAGVDIKKNTFVIDPSPVIKSVTPEYGVTNGIITVSIKGQHFFEDTKVWLTSKIDKIQGEETEILSLEEIITKFNLKNKPISLWDIEVENKGGKSVLKAGFKTGKKSSLWKIISSPTQKDLNCIYVFSDETGVIGGDGVLLKDDKKGREMNWQIAGKVRMNDFHFFSSKKGFAIGQGLYHFSEGNWSYFSHWGGSSIYMRSNSEGWFISNGDVCKISFTDEHNWDIENILQPIYELSAIHRKWAVGKAGFVLKTNSWKRIDVPTVENLKDVYDDWAVGEKGTIIRFRGGEAKMVNSPTAQILNCIHRDFAVGERGTVIRYINNTWQEMITPTCRTLNAVFVVSPDNVLAVGESGLILHYYEGEDNIRNNEIEGVYFTSSYPNPFNPGCYIPVNGKCKRQKAKCKIYNILGQVVREINITSYPTPKIYWDGRDEKGEKVNSGVYFYQFLVGDKVVGIRKSLVLK